MKSQIGISSMVLGALLLAADAARADDPFTCPTGSIQWTGNAGDGRCAGGTVTGNYTQTSGGTLLSNFGSTYTYHINGTATLAGALDIQVNPKHPPASGASYTAVTAGSLSGSFTSHTSGFTLTTSGNSIQVTKQ